MLYVALWLFFSWVIHRLWLEKGRRFGFLVAIFLSPMIALAIGTVLEKKTSIKKFPDWIVDVPAVCLPILSFFIIAGAVSSIFVSVNTGRMYDKVAADAVLALALAYCPTVFRSAIRNWIASQQSQPSASIPTAPTTTPATPTAAVPPVSRAPFASILEHDTVPPQQKKRFPPPELDY